MTQARTYSVFSSAGTLISVFSVLFYCAGFVRVEIKLNEQEKRMSELEKLLKVNLPPSSEASPSKQDLTMALAGRCFCDKVLSFTVHDHSLYVPY